MLQNGKTYFKNLAVFTLSLLSYFSTLCMKRSIGKNQNLCQMILVNEKDVATSRESEISMNNSAFFLQSVLSAPKV